MRNQNRAFTLIELLVVIAIIAILAAILFPVFAQAREAARKTSCLSNEKQVSLGVLMYVQDYDETFPVYWYGLPAALASDPPFTPNEPDTIIGWNEAIYPYIKNVQLFRCPDAPRQQTLTQGSDGSTFGSDDTAPTGATGYAINARISGDTSYLDNTPAQPPAAGLAALSFPAVTILLSEASSHCSDGCASSDENEWGWEGRHIDKLYGDGWDSGSEPGAAFITTGKPVLARHNGGANYALSDGHVKFYNAAAEGLLANPTSNTQAEKAVGFALGFTDPLGPNDSNTGQKITYCLDQNCRYNVPPNP